MSDTDLDLTFNRTSGGLLAAQADELAFLAVSAGQGGFSVASACNLVGDPLGWEPSQFWTVHRRVADEEAFRAHATEIARHRCDVARLDRQEIAQGTPTPWGVAQVSRVYAPGIVQHATAGHGGFGLDAVRNAVVHAPYRSAGGWYEDDCEWAKVAASFPELFTAFERDCADRTLRDAEPDPYELVNGMVLEPGASRTKDARRLAREHAENWVVVSAITSGQHPGFVECAATRGGERRPGCEERRFLVAAQTYEVGSFGFVIDEGRDQAYAGPSSFAGAAGW